MKGLLELLGGTVTVQSAVGTGSVFSVRLPCRVLPDAEPALRPRATAAARAVENATVVVAEDNGINQLFIRKMLEAEGYRVLSAFDEEGVPEILKSELPHLILMDIQMPGMDGIACARAILQPESTAISQAV